MTSPNTLTDAIRNAVLYQLMNVHIAFPAKVIKYDYTVKKAQLQPMIDKKFTDGTVQPMPILNDVPVIFPVAGGASLTFPVNEGDTCLVVCCERCIDTWVETGQQAPPPDPRKWDLSDAVAIVGLTPFNVENPATNNTDVLLTYKGSKIIIRENGDVVIDTASKVAIGTSANELLKILSDLLDSLSTSITTTVGQPIQGALPALTYSNLKAQVEAIRGTI